MNPSSFGRGRFVVSSSLGEGGMAQVFRVWDTRMQVWRALKAMAPHYAQKKQLRQRFLHEAQAMASLEHDHVVRAYDVADDEDVPYIVMELVEGGSLEAWIERHGAMPPHMAVSAMVQVCEGVAAAHAKGMVHRDLKPANVLITLDGQCRIADFGIARAVDTAGMTRTGVVMGTMGYMAPEQGVDAKHIDGRADIYSLGATLYALVSGQIPHHLFAAVNEGALDGLPSSLQEVIGRATLFRAADRYPTVAELAAALTAALPSLPSDPPGTPPLARTPSLPPPVPGSSGLEAPPRAPTPGPAPSHPTNPWAEGATPPPTDANRDKLARLQQMVGYVPTKPQVAGAARAVVVESEQVDDGLRPEEIRLTDEEQAALEEARRAAEQAASEGPGGSRPEESGLAGRTAKDGLEFLVQIVIAMLRFLRGPAIVIPIGIAAILGLGGAGVSGTRQEMEAVSARIQTQREVFLAGAEKVPDVITSLVSIGASESVLDRSWRDVQGAPDARVRAVAFSDLVGVMRAQLDRQLLRASADERPTMQTVDRQISALESTRAAYEAERDTLFELCGSAQGAFVDFLRLSSACDEVSVEVPASPG